MPPPFVAWPVHVRAPATSANLGPGFDALGLALALYDDVTALVATSGLLVEVSGHGEALARDESHLVVRAMRACFERLGGQPGGIELSCTNRIPHARGLGSSAAAIVAGVLLARGLVRDGADLLSDADALVLADEVEGHPDNVAACLLGGLTIAWSEDGTARAVHLDTHPTVRPVVLVPPFESSTAEARGLLPAVVPHADAAHASGRSALLVAALTGAPDVLLAATDDRLHQRYRQAAMPASLMLMDALRAGGTAAVVSGAGPTVLALAKTDEEVQTVLAAVPDGWRAMQLGVERRGARVDPQPQHARNTPGIPGVAACGESV